MRVRNPTLLFNSVDILIVTAVYDNLSRALISIAVTGGEGGASMGMRTSTAGATSIIRQGRRAVAAVVNEYWAGSHADLFVTKLCDGYEVMWTPVPPHIDVTSLYVHDPGPADIGSRIAKDRGIDTFQSVAEAVRSGGPRVAVDGVVLIGERNERSGRGLELDERGRPVDPRHDFFMAAARVCEEDRRPVPVFIDKYLGHSWEQARTVYSTARALGMPLMAGSSVPVTMRPPSQVPLGAKVEEIVAVATGAGEAPIFHSLELVQSMIERRQDYETGVVSVQFLRGPAFWSAWKSNERWSGALLAAVPHFEMPPWEYYERQRAEADPRAAARDGRPSVPTGAEEAVCVEYLDGVPVDHPAADRLHAAACGGDPAAWRGVPPGHVDPDRREAHAAGNGRDQGGTARPAEATNLELRPSGVLHRRVHADRNLPVPDRADAADQRCP
jgi:hypothetical protein